jgi:nickel transport protein
MLKKIVLALLLLAPVGVPATLQAKDLWLISKSDHLELNYGYDVPELYNPAKVTDLKAWDVEGKPVLLQHGMATDLLTLVPNKQAALISVSFDDGYWVQSSSTEWKNVSLEVAHGFRACRHPLNFHKSFYAWSKSWTKPIGLKLEIVPLQDPFKTPLGKSLPVQVFFDGKPLPAAKVWFGVHGDKALTMTADKNGKIKIPVTPVPEQFVAASYEPHTLAADGSQVVYATSLRYELK